MSAETMYSEFGPNTRVLFNGDVVIIKDSERTKKELERRIPIESAIIGKSSIVSIGECPCCGAIPGIEKIPVLSLSSVLIEKDVTTAEMISHLRKMNLANKTVLRHAELTSFETQFGLWSMVQGTTDRYPNNLSNTWSAMQLVDPLNAVKVATADLLFDMQVTQDVRHRTGIAYAALGDTLQNESIRQVLHGVIAKRDTWLEQKIGGTIYTVVPGYVSSSVNRFLAKESFLTDDLYSQSRLVLEHNAKMAQRLVEEQAKRFTLWDAFIALGDYKIKSAIPSVVAARLTLKKVENRLLLHMATPLDDISGSLPKFLLNQTDADEKVSALRKSLAAGGLAEKKLGVVQEALIGVAPKCARGALRIILTIAPETYRACVDMRYVLAFKRLLALRNS